MTPDREEGDSCPAPGCGGRLVYEPDGGCTCHISPPCWACTEANLVCNECGKDPHVPTI